MKKMIRTILLSFLLAFACGLDLLADSGLQLVFVDPYGGSDQNTGASWENALDEIQSGVELAHSFYSANGCQTYVLVKGSQKGVHTDQYVTMLDGVTVIGSIGGASAIECSYSSDAGVFSYGGVDCSDMSAVYALYVKDVLSLRDGIASPSAYKTVVSAIKTDGTAYNGTINTVVDGFVVTPNSDDGITQAIDVENGSSGALLCLRNVIVYGYHDLNTDVVRLKNALIYDALIRDNVCSTGNALSLLEGAYAVNVTVEGNTSGSVINSLVNYDDDRVPAIQNTLTLHNYPVSDDNLNYQLTEQSKYIDACGYANPLEGLSVLSSFIDYGSDRDLLGNLRLLSGVSSKDEVDAGAFETWRIDNTSVYTSADDNFYPHEGSVVYIMTGNNLFCGTDLTPAYLLVQSGASLYGQVKGTGHSINAAYVSIERDNMMSSGTVVGLPFAMDYLAGGSSSVALGVGIPNYSDDGVLSFKVEYPKIYTYDGSARSDWKYTFAVDTSLCWVRTELPVDACRGVLYLRYNDDGDVFRFTAKGKSMSDYVYTESETYKQVVLPCYNSSSFDNNVPNFSSSENMGWNCIGIPYLISRYKTFNPVRSEIHGIPNKSRFLMYAPRYVWAYYDGKVGPDGRSVDGTSGFYSVNSVIGTRYNWHVNETEDCGLWFGEGFFVQNAKWSGEDNLLFYRPYVDADFVASKKTNERYYFDYQSESPDNIGLPSLDVEDFNVYSLDGRKVLHPISGHVYIVNGCKKIIR